MTSALRLLAVTALALGVWAPAATAATPAPGWTIGSFAAPTDFSTADNAKCLAGLHGGEPRCDRYVVTATNAGSLPTDGGGVTIADTLPAGLTARGVALFWFGGGSSVTELTNGSGLCTTAPVRCVIPASFFEAHGDIQPDQQLEMVVYVTVDEPAAPGPLTNTATVSGGGADEATTSEQNAIGSEPAPFGLTGLISYLAGVDGAPYVQAGGHPYELTTTLDLANAFSDEYYGNVGDTTSVEDLRDVVVDLPVGFLGSALATPTCTLAELASEVGCPPDTRVGHILTEPAQGPESANGPINNLVPEQGVPAEFGFKDALHGSHVMYASVAPSPSGYVLRITTREIPQVQLTDVIINFYGDPALRDKSGNTPVAMLTSPSDCSGEPLTTTVHLDSWQRPGAFNAEGAPEFADPNWVSATTTTPPVTGCNQLQFHPTIKLRPTTSTAASPSGLNMSLDVPQSTNPATLATPPLKRTVVTLPTGMSINPSSAGGLTACTLAQLGMSASGVPTAAAPKCPESSKVGTVELETPLLARTLEGSVYVAAQGENPFGSLIALYIVVNDPATGTVIKLPGRVELSPSTGQITTVFDDTPQLPFSQLKLHLKEGPRAPLATPSSCGAYSSTTELTPWSAPDSGPPATPSDAFDVTSGPNGAPCPDPGPFAPSFLAGTTSNAAGAFSPFMLTLSRNDGDQTFSTVTTKLPLGLAGEISKVPLCGEADANAGSCPAASKIGHVTVQAGVGKEPITLPQAGKGQDPVYLTGPYKGEPFGLSIVVPAEAGPFNLDEGGHPVVVRAGIYIDPNTAQVTVVSSPMPSMLRGIPLDVKTVNVTIDRSEFMFNPTSCEPMQVGGTIVSTQGATASVSSRFQATNCATLHFKPAFSVSTSGKTSRKNGASLHVKLVYPKAPFGSQANIRSVKVNLPKQLPSRLTTLQKACPDSTFNSNPAACPSASRIGTAHAITPLVPVPLNGPAYFVSHGGAKFPELVIVLSGYGVTVQLHSETFINKAGITSSTFRTVPDVPVGTFELTLPQGKFSALAANGNLCKSKLAMPTAFTAQNGAVIHQSTPISVTGCKPSIAVMSQHVKGNTATIVASVPSAGRLVASGAGLSRASGSIPKAGTITLALTLSKQKQLLLKRHPGRKLAVAVKLLFTPTHGHTLSGGVTVLMG